MNYPLANLFYRYSELQSSTNYRPLQRSASINLKMSLSKAYKMQGQRQCPTHMPLDIFVLCVSGLPLTVGGLGESDLGLMKLVLLMGTESHKSGLSNVSPPPAVHKGQTGTILGNSPSLLSRIIGHGFLSRDALMGSGGSSPVCDFAPACFLLWHCPLAWPGLACPVNPLFLLPTRSLFLSLHPHPRFLNAEKLWEHFEV